MTRRIAVVSAGLSTPSSTRLLADRLTDATVRSLEEVGAAAEVEVVELRELAHPLADNLLTGFPAGALAEAVESVRTADALIAVTPVFSASYSGLFKTFFDVLEPGLLVGRPVLMGATAGTARHSLVLEHAVRPLFAYLRAVPVPTAVFAASEDFGSTADGQLQGRVARAAAELASLMARTPTPTPAPGVARPRTVEERLEEPTPFEELLARI